MTHHPQFCKHSFAWRFLFFSLILFFISAFDISHPQSLSAEPEETPEAAAETSQDPFQPAEPSKLAQLRQFIDDALITESRELENLKEERTRLEKYVQMIIMEMNIYEIQVSGQTNLILRPDTPPDELEKAKTDNDQSLKRIDGYLRHVREKMTAITPKQQQTADQLALHSKQLSDIKNEMPENPITDALAGDFSSLVDQLGRKQEIYDELRALYEKTSDALGKTRNHLSEMTVKLETAIAESKKKALFTREKGTFTSIDFSKIDDEFTTIPGSLKTVIRKDFQMIREKGIFSLSSFAILIILIELILFKFRSYGLERARREELAKDCPWRHFVLNFLCSSLPLAGTTLFLFSYGYIRHFHVTLHFFEDLSFVLFIWLFTQWGFDYLSLSSRFRLRPVPTHLSSVLRGLLIGIRFFSVSLAVAHLGSDAGSNLLSLIRICYYLMILGCLALIGHRHRNAVPAETADMRPHTVIGVIVSISYAIPIAGLILELVGFDTFSNYWRFSWILTLTGTLWGWLTFHLIREWGDRFNASSSLSTSQEIKERRPLKWLMIQFSWLIWIESAVLAAVFAWHVDKTAVISGYYKILRAPLPIPNFNISFLNIFATVMVLIITLAATRLWRRLLTEKFFLHSGMETGLRNSITLVSSYILWFLGILIGLNTLGIKGSSIAVAFGGLGIGLGFGLQAIFNNFVSGIILLFERPIEVGDVVEINGLWGEVKKINVRSTIVLTYDYATLIIPNSEMISNQVTNWSFKDHRIRRNIDIGVAYGTDVELVLQTLLEIADSTYDILKYPAPSALFTNFGDSALHFRLRYYTDLDYSLTTETEVRTKIDRIFREKGIEIPFPQQDVHLYYRKKEKPPFIRPEEEDAPLFPNRPTEPEGEIS